MEFSIVTLRVVVGCLAGVGSNNAVVAGQSTPAAATIRVHANGSTTVPTNGVTRWLEAVRRSEARQVLFDFGLPSQGAERRWREDDRLPVFWTRWEKDGIRYTQTVLLTRLAEGDLLPGGKSPSDAVLMVQLAGENTDSEYREATATFSVRVAGQLLDLELNDGLAYVLEPKRRSILAAVDVPAGGAAGTNGTVLRFEGNMPPGTTGAMFLKFPASPIEDAEALEQLKYLDFDEQLRRVKQFWSFRLRTNATVHPLIRWADDTQPTR